MTFLHKEDGMMRIIVPSRRCHPHCIIDNNILSIEFKDALDNLTIHITDENSNIIYENTFSGAMGDIIDIPVNGMRTGTYQVILTHKLGWLVGEFENQ